jgi:hypothetical protein
VFVPSFIFAGMPNRSAKILRLLCLTALLAASVPLSCRHTPFAPSRKVARLRVAAFRSDLTPPPGAPLIWVTPVVAVDDPLWAKGIVLDDGRNRYVLCAVDWCALCNSTEMLFRRKIAAAAGTDVSRVAIHTIHQHTAPYVDGDAYNLLDKLPSPPLRLSEQFLEDVTDRLADAVRQSIARLEPFDRVGTGEARVERVASARRLPGEGGKIIVRYSNAALKPDMAAAPEGDIDPILKTVTFARGNRPLVRLHYYATHPQTHQLDGRASADFVGAAREGLERQEKVFQVYFTGCSGDVTVGKYNDGSARARNELRQRLQAGMEASIASTHWAPAGRLIWRMASVTLPAKTDLTSATTVFRSKIANRGKVRDDDLYRSAITVAFAQRQTPLMLTSLQIGNVHIVHLPGEPMLEFQKFAQGVRPGSFVAVAGYGDCCTGYICTDQAHVEGGYEPTASLVSPGAEALMKNAIQQLLRE